MMLLKRGLAPGATASSFIVLVSCAIIGGATAFVDFGASTLPISLSAFLLATALGASVFRRVDMFEPLNVFLISYLLLFVVRPIYAIAHDALQRGFLGYPIPDTYPAALGLALAGAAAYTVSYLAIGRRRTKPARPSIEPTDSDLRRGVILGAVVTLGSAAVLAFFIAENGGLPFLWNLLSGRSEELASVLRMSSGYLYAAPLAATGVGIWFFTWGLKDDRPRMFWAGIGVTIYSQILSLGSGSRSYLLPAAMGLSIAYYLARGRRPKARTIAIVLVFVFLIGVTLPRVYRNENLNKGGISDTVVTALEPSQLFDEFLLGQDTGMIDALAIEVDQVPDRLPYAYGSTYVEALVRPVPKELLAAKPPSADAILNAAFFPDSSSRGLGVSFSIFGEPYLNAGWLGVVAVLALFGWGCARFWRYVSDRFPDPNAISLAALCIPYVFVFFRGGFGVDYHRLLFALLPLLLVIAVSRPRRQREATSSRRMQVPSSAS